MMNHQRADTSQIRPVILSGGSGTRLWPLSRKGAPKQFLPLNGSLSPFEETAMRFDRDPRFAEPMVVCGDGHMDSAIRLFDRWGVTSDALIAEPVARGTAPAIMLAAFQAAERQPNEVLCVLPSDHIIADGCALMDAIERGARAARAGHIVCLGMAADRPETGYGYIAKGGPTSEEGIARIDAFIEKPDGETAETLISQGEFLWNGGIVIATAGKILEQATTWAPMVRTAVRAALAGAKIEEQNGRKVVFPSLNSFKQAPDISFDHAVLERTNSAAVVPVDCGWTDAGDWSALWRTSIKDDDGNATSGDTILEGSRNCLIRATGDRVVAAVGLEDIAVVDTADAVLICHRDRAQDVKAVANTLKAQNRPEVTSHKTVERPWGAYTGIDLGENHQVKHITVTPGGRLSLQLHHHRAEHWVVVGGTATVTVGESVQDLTVGQHIHIPLGEVHRLENFGTDPVHLIEVQIGGYLGEDDIVRLEDVYGRTPEPVAAASPVKETA